MRGWAGTGEAYASSYASLCLGTASALRAALASVDDRTLLDVGSGTGALLAEFAAVGWAVTGCEPEASMRAVAEREHPDLTWASGALPALPFPDASFGAVVANFVLNHVPDPRVSARELARVARVRVAATIWVRSPSWFWREICDRAGLVPAEGERLPEDRDFARSGEGFQRMLSDAGWREIAVQEQTWTWEASPEALWASAEGGVAAAGATYRRLGADDRRHFRAAFDEICAEREQGGAIPLEHTAAIAVGAPR